MKTKKIEILNIRKISIEKLDKLTTLKDYNYISSKNKIFSEEFIDIHYKNFIPKINTIEDCFNIFRQFIKPMKSEHLKCIYDNKFFEYQDYNILISKYNIIINKFLIEKGYFTPDDYFNEDIICNFMYNNQFEDMLLLAENLHNYDEFYIIIIEYLNVVLYHINKFDSVHKLINGFLNAGINIGDPIIIFNNRTDLLTKLINELICGYIINDYSNKDVIKILKNFLNIAGEYFDPKFDYRYEYTCVDSSDSTVEEINDILANFYLY